MARRKKTSEPATPTALELASVDELLEELLGRFGAAVFIGTQYDRGLERTWFKQAGSLLTSLGQTALVQRRLTDEWKGKRLRRDTLPPHDDDLDED